MVAAILEGGKVTIDVARLRELHQPMYGHTGDPCSWCREWTPCPVTELLDAYEERDRLRSQRDKAATTLEMVKALADGYSWLSEGRGSYEWDDGRYDDDVRTFTSQLLKLLPRDRWLGLREWEAKYREAEEERDRLRVMLERLRNRMAEPDQPIIQWDAGTWIAYIDAALEGRE